MKRNYKIIIPIVILAGLLFSFQITNKPDPEKDKILIGLIRYALTKGHYEPHQINDEFSEQVFIDFIDALDPYKRFFIQSDIDEFSKYKYLIDDQLKNEEFTFYSSVFERYNQRVIESKDYYKEILKTPFDFEKEGTFNIDYDEKSFAKSKAELIKTWQLQLKVSTLSRLHEKIELQKTFSEKSVSEKSKEHKMINGEVVEIIQEKDISDTNKLNVPKTFAELEKESREAAEKSLDDFYNFMNELDDTDWFSVYINTITLQFDPHTSYLAPKDKKRFDISMAGKLEGIGARLQKKDDYTRVSELISGGPAWIAGELEVGDLILKVAQGDEPPVDIVGMRLDDAIEFIKGKKKHITQIYILSRFMTGQRCTLKVTRQLI